MASVIQARQAAQPCRTRFGLIEASLLSLLAGDVFRNRSIQRRLLVFKAIYYAHNVFNPRRTIAAWKRRRQIIRNAHAADTSTTPALS